MTQEPSAARGGPDEQSEPAARRRVLQGHGAGVAGFLFAILFTWGFLLLDQGPGRTAGNDTLVSYYQGSGGTAILLAGFYLVPFAGLAFLWFMAASRHRIGQLAHHEHTLFATVQLASGIAFVAMFFAAAAAAVSGVAASRLGGVPAGDLVGTTRTMLTYGDALLMIFGFRMAGVFILVTTTRALRAHLFPRWFAALSYAGVLVLLFSLSYVRWIVLIIPVWVFAATAITLFRRRTGKQLEA
ncbi:hypothetical protein ACFT5B_10645 [Luteimicrobium sp. NPDC057192]|uniref:hypothetical protein n=1 Tax=Luteimicrobium sp. NPDC057192 TaxID=3346042 RepID=UPI0036450E9F